MIKKPKQTTLKPTFALTGQLLLRILGATTVIVGVFVMAWAHEVWSQVKELDKRQQQVEKYIEVQNVYNERLLKLLEKQEQQPTPVPNQHRRHER